MAEKVVFYVDHHRGEAVGASWEALRAARTIAGSLGSEVTALVVGHGVGALAEEAIRHGAKDAVVRESPELEAFRPEPYADTVSAALKEAGPVAFVLPTTGRTRELAALVGVDLDTGVITDGIAVEMDGEAVVVTPC